ncbi:MAG TPA: hypothetical protein VMG41_04445 [Gemmatimonadales bacterium]|nr:hypothetical protein [Gemmatimonadales bacterium]
MTPRGYQDFTPASPSRAARLADLVDGLLYEAHVIGELRQALLRQRAGVAADDAEAVESSVQAMGRTLLTLDEAKRRRAALTALITGGEPAPLDRLESLLGGSVPPELEEARTMLKRAALQAAQDVAINQHILKRALEAGDLFLQKLFSMAGDPAPSYARGEQPRDTTPPSGLILNRTA